MNKIKVKNIMVFAILFIISLILIANPLNNTSDDIVYKNAFNSVPTFFTWAKEFSALWGGRIVALGLCTIFLNVNVKLYMITNICIIIALIYSIYKIINVNTKKDVSNLNLMLLVVMSLFLCIDKSIMGDSVIWVTGAFNYLWPCMALIIAMIPFVKILNDQDIKKWEYIIYFLSLILASNIEQTGAVLVVFSTILLVISLIKKKKIPKLMIFNYIATVIIFIISFAVQGNDVRFEAELLRYYQDFDMLSIFDKLFLGGALVLNHLINKSTLIILIMSISIMLISINSKDKKRIILSSIPLGYSLLKAVPLNNLFSRIIGFNIEKNLDKFLFTFSKYSIETICNPFTYIQIIIGVFVFICLSILIFYSFKDIKKSIIYTLIYFAGICASLALSFSPTIFASGSRIFFVNDIMNLIICSALINEISKGDTKNKKSYIIFTIFVLLMGFINLLNYIKF